jgi:hypothetical protein
MNKSFNTKLIDNGRDQQRRDNAAFVIDSIRKTKSNWFKCEMLRNLYFYLDFDFVREELKQIYISGNDEVRSTIKALHDGTLDVSDLIEQAKRNEEYFAESDAIYAQYERELAEQEMLEALDLTIPTGSLQGADLAILRMTKNN